MAPVEDDISIEEKRVYAGTTGRTDAYVATDNGVVHVGMSGDKIGGFSLASNRPARDVAVLTGSDGSGQSLAVATDEDLWIAELEDDSEDEPRPDEITLEATGVGPTVAVGVHGDAFLVAGPDGRIGRLPSPFTGDGRKEKRPAVERVGEVRDPRAVDGPLVAAGDGVYRVIEHRDGMPTVEHVGLNAVVDVAGAGVPLAATKRGLYWLGNGWMKALEGACSVVAADGTGTAMGAVEGRLFVHDGDGQAGVDGSIGRWDPGTWRTAELPAAEPPAALSIGTNLSVVVTAGGSLCVEAGDGWRSQALGVVGSRAIALAEPGYRA